MGFSLALCPRTLTLDAAGCESLLRVREDGRSKRDLTVGTLDTHIGLGQVGLDGGALASSSHTQHDAYLAPGQVDHRLQEVTHNLLLGGLAVNALQPLLVQSVRVRGDRLRSRAAPWQLRPPAAVHIARTPCLLLRSAPLCMCSLAG